MLRLSGRWRREAAPGQLDLAFEAASPTPAHDEGTGDPVEPGHDPGPGADPADALLARLRALGLRHIARCTLTRNGSTMVSFRGDALRVHEAFVAASPEMLRAVVGFVNGRGAVRRAARRVLRGFEPPPGPPPARPRRRPASHPADAAIVERLRAAHTGLNAERFDGALGAVAIRVSRRMRSRLGHYSPGTRTEPEIAIARRHVRRDGWASVLETLVHEMVHQWQHETGRPVAHDPDFRRKCREVGIAPHAKRPAGPREVAPWPRRRS
jgi:hypothetical protein